MDRMTAWIVLNVAATISDDRVYEIVAGWEKKHKLSKRTGKPLCECDFNEIAQAMEEATNG